jgi:N-glycosylase/DNA lyase
MEMENLSGLLVRIKKLQSGELKELVDLRMGEFRALGRKGKEELFSELCFCIMTANFNAERSIRIQEGLGRGFCTLPEERIESALKEGGHRFPKARAGYISEAKKHIPGLEKTIRGFGSEAELREWLAKNVKGLGYKESSHFMRNIGFTDIAIVDFHIVDLLVRYGLIERPKTLTPKRYLEIENVLRGIGRKAGLNLAELDLYLWYMETGKLLK